MVCAQLYLEGAQEGFCSYDFGRAALAVRARWSALEEMVRTPDGRPWGVVGRVGVCRHLVLAGFSVCLSLARRCFLHGFAFQPRSLPCLRSRD